MFAAPPASAPATVAQAAQAPAVQAQPAATEGHVVLHCAVTTEGAFEACTVVSEKPSGHALGRAAIQAAAHMHVQPVIRDGRPQAGYMTLPFKFVLEADGSPAVVSTPSPSR